MKAERAIEQQIIPTIKRAENRVPLWVMPSVKAFILLIDAALAVGCFLLAFTLREGGEIFSKTAWAWSKEFVPYAGILFSVVPIRLAMLLYQRVFQLQGAFSYIAEFVKILKAVSIGSLFLITFTFFFRGGFAFREFSYARGLFVFDFLFALTAFSVFHLGLRYLQTIVRKRDINLIPTLIIGQNAEAEQTITTLKERPDLGYRVVGIVSTNGNQIRVADTPIVGNLDDLSDIIRNLSIQEVIITDSNLASEKLFDAMMNIGRERRVEFRLAPSLFNFLPQKTSVDQIGILPMVRLFREPLSEAERFLKRLFDIVISLITITLTSPIWLVISLLIKLDSKGSILFKQERIGMDGRVFLFYKFRTMIDGADEELHKEAYKKNIEGLKEANGGNDKKPVFGKVKNDPRITRIGRILRRTSLDEMPQFLNVLRGQMSVVGPRPPIQYEVEAYKIWQRRRLDMKPGISGLWQVSGRNRLNFEEMVKLDLYYIENWSLWLDLKIILLTLPAIWRG